VDAFAGVENTRIKACKFYPFSMRKDWRQQQEFAHESNNCGFTNAFDADQQLNISVKIYQAMTVN